MNLRKRGNPSETTANKKKKTVPMKKLNSKKGQKRPNIVHRLSENSDRQIDLHTLQQKNTNLVCESEEDESEDDCVRYEGDVRVDKILDRRVTQSGEVLYFIKWHLLPHDENCWVEEEDMSCPDKIREYEERLIREAEEKKRLKAEWEVEKVRRREERKAETVQRNIIKAAEKEREKLEKAKIRAEKARLRAEKLMQKQKEKEAALKETQESETTQSNSEENNLDDATVKNGENAAS